MLPDSFIEELCRRSDIVEVVSEYVQLKRKGANHFGLCPFHGEKTPSFSVNQERQIYHCFGCGKGGSVIGFVMEIENLAFMDAVHFLARRANMEVPQDGGYDALKKEKRERIFALNVAAAKFYHRILFAAGDNAPLEYMRARGIALQTAVRFGLGAAPDGWDALITAMAAEGYEKADLIEAGLAVHNRETGRIYDRFRNRLMFPIIDVRGKVIGFGGRVFDDSTPKYLNSPDTAVFNKSRNLFALNLAKKTKQSRLILAEGYMDVISLHQAGFDCAVASLGTALTEEQASLMAHYKKEVVIAYDSDEAGVKAAQRAIGILGKTDMAVKVLHMEGSKDPDEFIKRKGPVAFSQLLDRSANHIEYRLNLIRLGHDLDQSAEKVAYLSEAIALLSSLDSAVEREVYGARVAEAAGVTPDSVAAEVRRGLRKRLGAEKKKQERHVLQPSARLQPADRNLRYVNLRSARAEEGIIRLALMDPTVFDSADRLSKEDFSSELLGRFYFALSERYRNGQAVTIPSLSGQFENVEMAHIAAIAEQPESSDNILKALADYISVIKSERSKREGERDLLELQSKLRQKEGIGQDGR